MPKTISKTMTVTRVSYKTVEVENGEPRFVDHTDAVFSGMLEKDKVERLLKAQLGKDAMIVVTNVDAGQHRFEMNLDTFVLNARIADGEPEEPADGSADADSCDGSAADPSPTADFQSDPAPIPAPAPVPEPVPQEDGDEPESAGGAGENGEEEDEAAPF